MRTVIGLVWAVALIVGVPAAGAVVPCGPPHAATLASDRMARIYASGGEVFGCARGGAKTYRLGASEGTIREQQVGPVALTGSVAAYGLSEFGVDTRSASVVVRRLTNGAQLREEGATTRPVGPEFFESVDSLVVDGRGDVAWISTAGSIISNRAEEIEVNRVDRRGRALLDSGSGIDTKSLRRRGARIFWIDGRRTRSAGLS